MHEFSMADGLVKAVLQELKKHKAPPGSLRRVRVVVGALHQIVPENMEFAYEVLTRDTPAAGSELELRTAPACAACRICGWRGNLRPPFFLCGACRSGEIEVTGGKELYLDNLEIEQDGD